MAKLPELKGLYRVIDANINRAKEGLRVCEEITRFILDDKLLTARIKKIRHCIDPLAAALRKNPELLAQRNSAKDVGLKIKSRAELKRSDLADVFSANIQRVKESIRVLEEFSKLEDVNIALGFRKIRYVIYDFEKKAAKKILSLRSTE